MVQVQAGGRWLPSGLPSGVSGWKVNLGIKNRTTGKHDAALSWTEHPITCPEPATEMSDAPSYCLQGMEDSASLEHRFLHDPEAEYARILRIVRDSNENQRILDDVLSLQLTSATTNKPPS